jgi:IS4 transposase
MGMAVLMYNVWLVVDFLVQVSMAVEVRRKPRVTADQFRRHLRRRLDRLI